MQKNSILFTVDSRYLYKEENTHYFFCTCGEKKKTQDTITHCPSCREKLEIIAEKNEFLHVESYGYSLKETEDTITLLVMRDHYDFNSYVRKSELKMKAYEDNWQFVYNKKTNKTILEKENGEFITDLQEDLQESGGVYSWETGMFKILGKKGKDKTLEFITKIFEARGIKDKNPEDFLVQDKIVYAIA